MEEYFQTLDLNVDASMEEARNAYHAVAAEYHPDNVSDITSKYRSRRKLIAVDKAWAALQQHFYEKDEISTAERKFDYYYSDVELLEMAKIEQAARREQPRGAIRVHWNENLPAGLYEEYERVRIRNLGYIFDGEAMVGRVQGLDIVYGSLIFKNTIFNNAVSFKPRKFDSPKRSPRALATAQTAEPAVFREETVFNEEVEFDVRAVFEGPVVFLKTAAFRDKVTFCVKPVISTVGISHVQTNHVWENA